jgi:hypothetical protein
VAVAKRPGAVISRREWAWAAGLALVVMALTTVPYMLAASRSSPAWGFGGFLLAVDDGNSYIAKMAEGAHGAWLFTLPYTSEPQRGAILFSFYLLLGRLVGPQHTALVAAFHAARVVSGFALLLCSYLFLAQFLPEARQRRLGLLLVALGGGLGWLITLLVPNELFNSLPVDFISPEAFSFLVLFGFPHLAAARSLLLLGLVAFLRGHGGRAGLALLGVGLLQPLAVVVGWAVVATFLALSGWRQRLGQSWRRDAWAAIRLGLVSAPSLVYTVYIFSVDPVLAQWNAQNQLPSPHPAHYLLAYGVWLALAVAGWAVLRRRDSRLAGFAGGWILLAPLLLWLPIATQRRLIEGLQLPLAALAVLGLTVALQRWQRWLTPVVLFLTLPTAVMLWLGALAVGRVPSEPIFHPHDQLSAFAWLAENGRPGQVVLSAQPTGNALPAYTGLVAYIGHGPETLNLPHKAALVAAFYRGSTQAVERRALLSSGRITFVIFGPHERGLGDFDPALASYLTQRFSEGEYAVYEVTP